MPPDDETLSRALAHHQAGRLAEAEQLYRAILAADPNHAGALHLLGVLAMQSGRAADAARLIRQAIARNPRESVFHSNLGEACRALGQIDDAIAAFRRSLELAPDFPAAHNNLALALTISGQLSEARQHFERAIALDPNYVEPHYNLARVLLLEGDYQRGWAQFGWRERMRGHPSQRFALPTWSGTAELHRRVLLYAEQGLGDTIQFIRYVPLVQERVRNVTVAVQPALVPLLTSSGYPVVGMNEQLTAANLRCSLASLPALTSESGEPYAPQCPYLTPEPARVEKWLNRLQSTQGVRIGIAWQGNPAFYSDRFRSIPLLAFEPLARVPGVTLFSLQKDFGVEQIRQLGGRFPVVDLGEELDRDAPFLDTAAILASLDLVITSDTSIAHLAGALGVRTWLATSFAPDWRWLLAREDSPWYPSLRLFRQSRLGDWSDVFERMAAALALEKR